MTVGDLTLEQASSICQSQVSVRMGKEWTVLPLHNDLPWVPCARCEKAGRPRSFMPLGGATVKKQQPAVTDAGLVVGVVMYAPRTECLPGLCGWGCGVQDSYFIADPI